MSHLHELVKRNGHVVTTCDNAVHHSPAPHRIVGHHVLPQACGGVAVNADGSSNIAALCDNCHYTVHVAMWRMQFQPKLVAGMRLGAYLLKLAHDGWGAATLAGTAELMPQEAD